ncbi:hypothetical protein Golomagni_07833 [Golovinomyces magnicellulatus]|nr:hypothetical protein Golomagni_07833 [Golovinomyces magnicellulatus]
MSIPIRIRSCTLVALARQGRLFSTQTAYRIPYKDSQDKDSLKPQSTENTGSARDDDMSKHPSAAFTPSRNAPEEEHDVAGENTDGNPLDVSGANQALSKPQGDEWPSNPVKKTPSQKSSKSGGEKSKSG